MAKVKNVSGEDRWVPVLGREVKAGELLELDDDELAASLGEQPSNWELRKTKTTDPAPAEDK